jgi:uncharacterized membrane protein
LSPERLIAFSDGVIAIAITLLVLNMEIPNNYATMGFSDVMGESLKKFDTWLISFWIIGSFWIAHHKLFMKIKHIDVTILWYNLFFLLIITSLSWTVSLIEAYPDEPRAVAIFSLSLGLAGITHLLVKRHAQKKQFLEIDARASLHYALMATPVTALFSILCAFVISPTIGLYVWMLRHLFFMAGRKLDILVAR